MSETPDDSDRALRRAVVAADRKIEHAIRDLNLYPPRTNGHAWAQVNLRVGITELIDAKIALALKEARS